MGAITAVLRRAPAVGVVSILALILGSLPSHAAGGDVFVVASIRYVENNDGSVHVAGDEEFPLSGCDDPCPTSIVIPDTVTHNDTVYPVSWIGTNAFASVSAINDVTIGNNVTQIRAGAFYNSGFTGPLSLTLGSGVTDIGSNAFAGARLVNLWIPAQVTTIGNCTFCSIPTLRSLEVGGGVATVGNAAFAQATALETIRFYGAMPTMPAGSFGDGSEAPIRYTSGNAASWTSPPDNSPRTYVETSAPEITQQPQSTSVYVGQPTTLTVTATGDSVGEHSYRWYRNEVEIPGETSASLAVAPSNSPGSTSYRADATNWVGTTSSTAATVTVKRKSAQTATVVLPPKLKRAVGYRLPSKTNQGRPIGWTTSGPGRCTVRQFTVKCARPTGKAKAHIIGTAPGSTSLLPLRLDLARSVK